MAAAAAATGAALPPEDSAVLTEELKAQFNEQISVLAVRVPKQTTNQYMKQLSK